MSAGERGSVTLWMVGMVLVVFLVGGIGLDLWRGLTAHRLVATVVDSAAVAAGSGIDEGAWRSGGELRLDPEVVDERVAAVVAAQSVEGVQIRVTVAPDALSATVTGSTHVDLTLLALLVSEGFTVSASASAAPVLWP